MRVSPLCPQRVTRYDDDDGTGRLPGTVHQQTQKARPTEKMQAIKKCQANKKRPSLCDTYTCAISFLKLMCLYYTCTIALL